MTGNEFTYEDENGNIHYNCKLIWRDSRGLDHEFVPAEYDFIEIKQKGEIDEKKGWRNL